MESDEVNFEQSIEARNARIKAILLADGLPVLPFELELLQEQFKGLVGEQNELSKLLGEAMSQTSETWHDNAPADAINLESRRLSSRARKVVESLHLAQDVGYPPREQKVTVGSIIEVQISGKDDAQHLLLTGSTMGDFDHHVGRDLPEDTMAITVQSPLGFAALDAVAGQTVEYEVGGTVRTFKVIQVSQLLPI